MILKASFSIFLSFCLGLQTLNAQTEADTTFVGSIKITDKKLIKNSDLCLLDSGKVLSDFLGNKETEDFINSYKDSNYSFVSSATLSYSNGKRVIKKKELHNIFDSLFYSVAEEKFLYYHWSSKKSKARKSYKIIATAIFNADDRSIKISFNEYRNNSFLPIYSITKDIN